MKALERSGGQVGNTPAIFMNGILIKDESKNPSGSVKIRPMAHMIQKAIESGLIIPGETKIVEATSGNMGIALAYEAQRIECPVTIFMPSSMTPERVQIMESLGAVVELVDSFEAAIRERDALGSQEGYFSTDQFLNPHNAEAHYLGLAPEIIEAARSHHKKIAAVVSGSGTGGTFMGLRKGISEAFPEAKFWLMEPEESQHVRTGKTGPHKIAGVQDGTVACQLDKGSVDHFVSVPGNAAIERAIELNEAGHEVGISSGANMLAAEKIATMHGIRADCDAVVVTLFPDHADRYSSVLV